MKAKNRSWLGECSVILLTLVLLLALAGCKQVCAAWSEGLLDGIDAPDGCGPRLESARVLHN